MSVALTSFLQNAHLLRQSQQLERLRGRRPLCCVLLHLPSQHKHGLIFYAGTSSPTPQVWSMKLAPTTRPSTANAPPSTCVATAVTAMESASPSTSTQCTKSLSSAKSPDRLKCLRKYPPAVLSPASSALLKPSPLTLEVSSLTPPDV